MERRVTTDYGAISYDRKVDSSRVAEEDKQGILEGRHLELFDDLSKVLSRDGVSYSHSGVVSMDIYQKNDDGLRLEYWCDAAGIGLMELGIQGNKRHKGYEPVLRFNFGLDNYRVEHWSEDLSNRVKEVCKVTHYIPGNSEEMREIASKILSWEGDWEEKLHTRAMGS